MGRMTLCGTVFRERLFSAFEKTVEQTQDFTDSAYTGHEHREKLLLICDRARTELNQLLRIAVSIVSHQPKLLSNVIRHVSRLRERMAVVPINFFVCMCVSMCMCFRLNGHSWFC